MRPSRSDDEARAERWRRFYAQKVIEHYTRDRHEETDADREHEALERTRYELGE